MAVSACSPENTLILRRNAAPDNTSAEPPQESWRLNSLSENEVNRMPKNTRLSPEVRQRAVRMVLGSLGAYDSQ